MDIAFFGAQYYYWNRMEFLLLDHVDGGEIVSLNCGHQRTY